MEPLTAQDFLNYHHLRYFWAVAREGGLRRAAEKLNVSQPSVCAQVQQLEAALGEELFRPRGRTLELTEFGQVIQGYAEEIFNLGAEVLRVARQAPTSRSLRLQAGIVDSFPKLLSYHILRPIFEHDPPVLLTCKEGKLEDLVGQLMSHRLDVVLADEPASPSMGRLFNHELGTCGMTFCAAPSLARRLKGRFPRNLHGAPALLPTQNCASRRSLDKWFANSGIEPRVVGEFEDAALAKIVGSEGCGFVVVPTLVESEAIERHGFVKLGRTTAVRATFHAITAERRLTHPAIIAITTRQSRAMPSKKTTKARRAL